MQALEETQILRVTSMSTALLTVFIDSAKNLPQARLQSKPDPYLVLSLGKATEQTAVQMRTDAPVWEQGFTFLVGNPDNDTLQMKIIDQKTEKEIGKFSFILNALLEKRNMEIISQPFQLQKSGPESKILMTLSLRIFKKSIGEIDDGTGSASSSSIVGDDLVSRSGSIRKIVDSSPNPSINASLNKQDSRVSTSSGVYDASAVGIEEPYTVTSSVLMSTATPPRTPDFISDSGTDLHHRVPSSTSSAGLGGRGRIQLTLRFSIQRQRLIVVVHKVMHIPLKDPTNIPDPYVKLYLLPGRSKDSKRKTNIIKDNCNPVYDTTFEYIISAGELMSSELEVTVATQKGFLSSGSPIIGLIKIPLNDNEISNQGITSWYDLLPDVKNE